jgi:hypothetical protein
MTLRTRPIVQLGPCLGEKVLGDQMIDAMSNGPDVGITRFSIAGTEMVGPDFASPRKGHPGQVMRARRNDLSAASTAKLPTAPVASVRGLR